jgi:hypothetical protein
MTRLFFPVIAALAIIGLSSSEAHGQTADSLFSTAGAAKLGAYRSLVGYVIVHLAGKDIIYLWEDHDGYPLARKTNNPSVVISPYPPHNRVLVTGIRSGELVMDPSVGKAFIRP